MEMMKFLDKNSAFCNFKRRGIFHLQSACVPCDIGHYQCPDGYTLESGTTTKGCVYSSGESQYKGCSSLCSREQTVYIWSQYNIINHVMFLIKETHNDVVDT